jgi:hypothetical protein
MDSESYGIQQKIHVKVPNSRNIVFLYEFSVIKRPFCLAISTFIVVSTSHFVAKIEPLILLCMIDEDVQKRTDNLFNG